MGRISGRVLFFVTSPRSPLKMIPEIKLLSEKFTGKPWSVQNQALFMEELLQDPSFQNVAKPKDPAFSARDRITRGPKSLGLVDLSPTIHLTEAGEQFIDEDLSQDALLRQLLKFQLPSPYHVESATIEGTYYVKPYLEIIRLIYTLESVSFDELMVFGMQLTDYRKFDSIIDKIVQFRNNRRNSNVSYKTYLGQVIENEILEIYEDEINAGETRTRETNDASLAKFIKTKSNNLRDYTDACFRYLRETGLISISQKNHSLYISDEKKDEVAYYLSNIDRKPVFIHDEANYKQYLFDVTLPKLYSDDREKLEYVASSLGVSNNLDTPELKKAVRRATDLKKASIISSEVTRLKALEEYDDVMSTFNDIKDKNLYDIPLMLEWNTWRAMTMLDGGNINANLTFDDLGQPLRTAAGNRADIVCEYDDFNITVEVTTSTGQKQYEMEGEPIARHLGKLKQDTGKTSYCFFIAPNISPASIAYCYQMYKISLAYYSGTTEILPLNLDTFIGMVHKAGKSDYTPEPTQLKALCEYAKKSALSANDENEWFNDLQDKAVKWLAA